MPGPEPNTGRLIVNTRDVQKNELCEAICADSDDALLARMLVLLFFFWLKLSLLINMTWFNWVTAYYFLPLGSSIARKYHQFIQSVFWRAMIRRCNIL